MIDILYSDNLVLKYDMIAFYSSNDIYLLNNKIIFDILSNIDKSILFIDLSYFDFSKRFNIKEVPTILSFKDGVETKRFCGIKAIKSLVEMI